MSNDKDIENVALRVHTVEQKIEEKVGDTAWANVAAKHVNESLGMVAEEVRDIGKRIKETKKARIEDCLLYTSPSPRDRQKSRMPSSA